MTIVESRLVTGGVDTHMDVHTAAVVDGNGGLLEVASFPADTVGYQGLFDWMAGFGSIARVGVEGTGAYGAGLARHLRRCGVVVIEVDRPNRQARRLHGKSDPLDAVEAARAALSGRAQGAPKAGDGRVEAIRALLVARRSARSARIAQLNQMRHLAVTAPDDLRAHLKGTTTTALVERTVALESDAGDDPARQAMTLSLRMLGRRVAGLEDEIAELDTHIRQLVTAAAPELLAVFGIGVLTAAILLTAVGDNAHRIRSEAAFAKLCGVAPLTASSGKVSRHRLNRGGNREANHALWRIAMVRMSNDPRTRTYVARKVEEGRSKPEILRLLKRYIAREVFTKLPTSS